MRCRHPPESSPCMTSLARESPYTQQLPQSAGMRTQVRKLCGRLYRDDIRSCVGSQVPAYRRVYNRNEPLAHIFAAQVSSWVDLHRVLVSSFQCGCFSSFVESECLSSFVRITSTPCFMRHECRGIMRKKGYISPAQAFFKRFPGGDCISLAYQDVDQVKIAAGMH